MMVVSQAMKKNVSIQYNMTNKSKARSKATSNTTRQALDVVAKHLHRNSKRINRSPGNRMRNVDVASLVIAHPNLARDPYHTNTRRQAENALVHLVYEVATHQVPMRDVRPELLRRLHARGDLSIALAEHEYWHPESDPRDLEYYLKHSKHHLIGIGPEEAMVLMDLNEAQQTRLIKAALCGRQPFRATGVDSRYTVMGTTLIHLWDATHHWSMYEVYHEDNLVEIRRSLMRAVLKAYRSCFKPRSTTQAPGRSATNAMAEINRIFASPLTTNAARNRAAAQIRRVTASVPRSRLAVGARALDLALKEYWSTYLKYTRYIDPFLSPYADVFKTILKSL